MIAAEEPGPARRTRPASERSEAADRLGISSEKVGMAPGSVVYTGTRRVDQVTISTITYTADDVVEAESVALTDLRPPTPQDDGIQWVNVVGLHDTDLVQALGDHFGLHPLLLEDVVSIGSRPTFIDYEYHAFISAKMLSWSDEQSVDTEHLSLILGDDYVISFQERPGDVFDHVRARIRAPTARIRRRNSQYLWYALIDAIVDHYLYVIEELAARVDHLEDRVWDEDDAAADVPQQVQRLRGEMAVVRRALRPLRDEIDEIAKEPPDWFDPDMHPFLDDLHAHVLQIADALESMRESLGAVMDAHLSVMSMKTNEVMKVLTIMASIFIPLTFIAGIYGMNFEHMPELGTPWGYPLVLAVMTGSGVAMAAYFKRNGWF
jgi:magnesium transporter